MAQSHNDIERIMAFLNEIGIETRLSTGAGGFLPGVEIHEGGLLVDPACEPSDLLHEAGHLAIVPDCFRHYMHGNVGHAQRRMLDEVDELLGADGVDHPLAIAVMQTSDPEATAWAWAAGVHLGIAHEKIILNHQYEDTGAEMRAMLKAGLYIGVNGMSHAGFCVTRPSLEKVFGRPCYPRLAFWTQKADIPDELKQGPAGERVRRREGMLG